MKAKLSKRITSIFLSVVLFMTYLPLTAAAETAGTGSGAAMTVSTAVADPGTADAWEDMLGRDIDGNRYAGRVWVDKSVYKNGDTAVLNREGDSGSSFQVSLQDDEAFQVIFSALGSTMTTTSTTTTTGPLDVVLVLDTSTSMDDTFKGVTRLERVITASNKLLQDLLTVPNVRIAIVTYNRDSETVLPLATYDNGIVLKVTNYLNNGQKGAGVVTAYDSNKTELGNDSGYTPGTNLYSGIDRGFNILAEATDVEGRVPVAIVLTDGQANRVSGKTFYKRDDGNVISVSDERLYLSTLLNAAYNKTKVEENYGAQQMVYGIGVDLDTNTTARLLMNPGDTSNKGFNSKNTSSDVKDAYEAFLDWASGNTVEFGRGNSEWTFDHDYPKQNGAITDAKIAANINYVDTYYDVSNANIESAFKQIYEELSSSVFNPISSSTSVDGVTGVDDTPLIYVDFIGQHMEVKEIQAITLFGSSYDVVKSGDGTYTVDEETGVNPTTNEAWNTAEDIKISVTDQEDGTQKLEIRINQEILPIIMERAVSETVGEVTTATITEYAQAPLRVYYTVGIDTDILLPSGDIDVSKIRGYQYIDDANGTVSFYSNQFGTISGDDNSQLRRDAHVGFKPSEENRFYYHQANQGIFTKITDENGNAVDIPANNEYGIVWNEELYNLTWMTYDEYLDAMNPDNGGMNDDSKVYTYVTYYRPTLEVGDAPNTAEEVTYLVYTNWKYLKESIAFYDAKTKTYLNDGKAIGVNEVESVIAAYMGSNSKAEIYAVLGVGSRRTSRLHNMMVSKTNNLTNTANESYIPEYLEQKAAHNDNDVIVWLGNNGKLTVPIDTGIALTKNVTEAIGNAEDTYALTVTIPTGVAAAPVVRDADGSDVTASISNYSSNVLTVNLKAGETVYISGIPGGAECQIGEIVSGDYYKVDAQSTASVTVATVSQVLSATDPAVQFVPATVTNAPYKYGDLTVIKDIAHNLTDIPGAMADKVFTFKVQLPTALAGKTYKVDAANASLFTGTDITVGEDGSFTVDLKDNESITIIDLPEGTVYTVTETSAVDGYTNTTGTVNGAIAGDGDHDAYFVNIYGNTPIKPAVTVTGTKILQDEHGTYDGNEDFTFVLSQYTTEVYVELARASAKAGESYTFQLDSVLTSELGIGEHYFRVMEESGTTPGMSYDPVSGLFVVRITDNDADGILEYAVENSANTIVNGNTVTKDFTNIYNVGRTFVDINIEKELVNETGRNLPLNMFSFELVNTQNPDNIQIPTQTINTDDSGKATLRLSNLGAGTYKYTLTEVDGGLAGMTYDTAPRYIVVEVTNDNGVLKAFTRIGNEPFVDPVSVADINLADVSGGDVSVAEVSNGDVSDGDVSVAEASNGDVSVAEVSSEVVSNDWVVFRNEYNLQETSYTISGTKKLEGRAINSSEFTFELYETDVSFVIADNAEAKETVGNNGEGFSFSGITYTKVGTYYYTVKEKAGNAAGVTYDTTHYHVTVTVGVDGAELKVTDLKVNKIGHNSDTTGNIVFVNTYEAKATEYALGGNKVLHGRAQKDGEFLFELYEGETLIETVANKADGSFAFKALPYTKAGTYTYTIKEVDGTGTVPGVAYNGVHAPVTVKVTVTDDVTNAALSASADVSNADIKFENTYTAESARIAFSGTKTLKGDTLADNSFTFKLYQTDNSFDITKDNAELLASTRNVNGAFSFARTLSTTGTYFFVIVEDATVDTIEDVVYDGTQYKFAVQVSDVGDGQLKAAVTDMNIGVTTASGASVTINNVDFTNATYDEVTEKEVYLEGNTTTQIDGKKVNAGDVLTYFITYTNYTGEDVVVDIMDTIPNYTTYVEDSASHNGTYVGTHVNWILNVARGESVTVSFKVKVDAANAIVPNEAIVRDSVNSYVTNEVVNHTVEEEFVKDVFSSADTNVSIDGEKVYEGDELLYKISFTNTTGNVADIKITDRIPANTTYVEGTADNGGVYNNGAIVWDIKEIPAWETVTVTFKVTVNSHIGAVTIKNQATATDGTNNYETEWVSNYTVRDEVGKKVYAADNNQVNIDGKQVYEGNELVYTITYKNTAKETARVTITDTIPQYTTYVADSADNGGVYDKGVIIWTKDVAAGETVTVSFKVKVNAGIGDKAISNEATIAEGKNSYTTNEVLNYTFEENDDPDSETPDEPTPTPVVPAAPATGDDTNLWLWFALLFICGGVIGGTVIYGKKKKVIEK